MTGRRHVFAVLVVAASLLLPAATASARPVRDGAVACGSITARLGGNDFSYRVRVVSGRVTCRNARLVLRGFIAHRVTPRGWFCTRGHSRDPWAASCARLSPQAVVRAYLIAG